MFLAAPRAVVLALVAVLSSAPCLLAAQATETKGRDVKKAVTFDHLASDDDRSYELRPRHGEAFEVRIKNTCPDVFAYEVKGIVRERGAEDEPGARTAKPLEEKVLPVVHDEKYGGYIVTITRTADTAPCADAEKLQNRTLLISTPTETWDLSFSGGFTLSSLSSPQYYLRPHPSDAAKKQVQQDPDKEDDANLGIATYVHVFHQRMPWLAGTFGLGIRDQNRTEYFLGGGVRLSDKATVNAGVVYGSVSRLKNGVNLVDPVSDDNVLNDLPTRTKRGFFIGVSYSFIDVRGKLQQPFAGAAGETPADTKVATKTPPAAACAVTVAPATAALGAKGSTATVKVSAKSDCEWKITGGTPAWVSFDTESGKGEKTITLTAKEEAADRSAKVEINGRLLTIEQKK